MLRRIISLCAVILVGALSPAPAFWHGASSLTFNTVVLNCQAWATSGTCGVVTSITGTGPWAVVGTTGGSTPAVSGTQVNLVNAGCNHCALTLMYQGAQVNVQQFQVTYTFIPNGFNFSFVLNNTNNQPSFNGDTFSSGAGCEGGFFQGFALSSPNAPNNLFALMLDQYGSETPTFFGDFQYSNVQIYQGSFASNAPLPPGQSPCNPDLSGPFPPENFTYASVTKLSTYPVPLNSPATTINTTTGDVYSATITYDGNNVIFTLYDVTAGGTCTPVTSATCYTNTWSGINIPAMVGANTAWVGVMGSTNGSVPNPLMVNTIEYLTP
jgi:hypothetical protein